jgi:hypothetical protein
MSNWYPYFLSQLHLVPSQFVLIPFCLKLWLLIYITENDIHFILINSNAYFQIHSNSS